MKDQCAGLRIAGKCRSCLRSALDDVQVFRQAGHLQQFLDRALARSNRHEGNATLLELLESGHQQANSHR
jgi:hypothetical protein